MTLSVFFELYCNGWMSKDSFHYVSFSFFLFICNEVYIEYRVTETWDTCTLLYIWWLRHIFGHGNESNRKKKTKKKLSIPINCLLKVISGRIDNLITFVLDQLVKISFVERSTLSESKLRNSMSNFRIIKHFIKWFIWLVF